MTRAALRLALADLYAKLADVERRIRDLNAVASLTLSPDKAGRCLRHWPRGPLHSCRPRATR
jgi:hypothetical protein